MNIRQLIAATLASAVACTSALADLKIVTTTPDFADMARQIGGEHVRAHAVMKGPENVHNVVATPTEMLELNAADLFVHSGLDAEPWRDNLMKGARNPRILSGRPGNVDMSEGVPLRDVPTGRIDRSLGDVHAYGNTHYTLDPRVAQRMAVTLVKAMVAADPANADLYKANAKRFVTEMGDVGREIRRAFAPYAGLKVITYHRGAWDYFADAAGIEIADTIEQKVMITPSPAEVRALIERAKRDGVRVVICGTYNDAKLAQYVADQIGGRMVVLPDHVNGAAGVDSYQKLFRHNAEKLIETARAAGVEPKTPNDAGTSGGGR